VRRTLENAFRPAGPASDSERRHTREGNRDVISKKGVTAPATIENSADSSLKPDV